MTLETAPLWEENVGEVYHARQYRRLLERMVGYDLTTSPGVAAGCVARPGDLAVTQRGAGANMSVDVAAGGAVVRGNDSGTAIGTYWAFNDATVNVAIAAADGSNPRRDLVGVHIRDTEYSGADDDARLIAITGTPAASPADPSLAAHPNFLTLARVTVPAAASSIVNANITDMRRRMAMLGGTIVCTSTTRPATNLFEGMMLWETDTDRHLVYDGTGWLVLSEPWQTYTPTITQNGSRTKTVNRADWRRTRTSCEVDILLTITQTGTALNAIQVSTPIAAAITQGVVGVGTFFDNSASRLIRGTARVIAGTVFDILWDRSYSLGPIGSDDSDFDSLTDPAGVAVGNNDQVNIVASFPISDANARA